MVPRAAVVLTAFALVRASGAAAAELVMAPGCEIQAKTPRGAIRIRAGAVIPPGRDEVVETERGPVTIRATELYPRTYYWGRCEGTVSLEPRSERWYGSLGAYFPGPGFHWRECEGVARAVVEEGQQHFKDVAEAMAWLKKNSQWTPFTYRNDGLVVGWATVIPYRKQLNVDVWQILTGGRKPTELPGADDRAVTMTCP